MLSAALTDGLAAIETACAEALADGVHSADVVLNILSRSRDLAPAATKSRARSPTAPDWRINPQSAGGAADDEPLPVNTGREWSDAEMNALGEMLVRGVSIEEIARRLRWDHVEVRDKVVGVGRGCRA
jgi:hypothetical protein